MSLVDFQSAMAQLVIDQRFRTRVKRTGEAAIHTGGTYDLTPTERRRLAAAARDPGFSITETMYRGFRIGRVVKTLPLTFALLGERRIASELRRFWRVQPPTTVFYVDEALAFCDYLRGRIGARGLRGVYLEEVLEYERAGILLQRRDREGQLPHRQGVQFRHDPFLLLQALRDGVHPRAIPLRRTLLVGERTANGILWKMADGHRATDGARRSRLPEIALGGPPS